MNSHHLDAAVGAFMLGSALLSAGKLPQAEWAFLEGRRFAEHDHRFPAKIAAIRYEMGKYPSAVYFTQRALSLLDPQLHDSTRQELYISMVKSCLLSGNLTKARTTIAHITSERDRQSLEQWVLYMEPMTTVYPDKKALWREVINRLPKCRPKMLAKFEFIATGSEPIRGLDAHLLIESDKEDQSYLFTNTGDARDVFATLFNIASAPENRILSVKKFYFTMVDPNSAAFARNLLMFRMLADWVRESSQEQWITIAALTYTFASQIMPSWVYDRLKKAIRCVSDELRTNVPLIMGRFCIDAKTRDSISSHFRNWQDPLRQPFNAGQILDITRQQLSEPQRILMEMAAKANTNKPRQVCEPDGPDSLFFRDLNFMLPTLPLLDENEPELVDLAERYGYMSDCPPLAGETQFTPRMSFTPQEIARDLYWEADIDSEAMVGRSAFLCIASFFATIARSSEKIQEQTMFKVIVDDAMNVMELAEHHLLNYDHPSIPDRYDMIDMSYLPDFVGGPLATFTYGIPILRHDKISEMMSVVSYNPTLWDTQDQFLTEYLLLADRSTITNTFATALTNRSSYMEALLSEKNPGSEGVMAMMQMPFSWTRTSMKPLSWDQIMPRCELTKWLHMHFLKLCLPPHRVKTSGRLVYMPLNMTAFFRLVIHLSRVGYPSHWLSAVLTEICSGRISTQARAPKGAIMDKSEAMHKYPQHDVFIKPFVEEFRTQFIIWRHLLPFGVLQNENPLPHISMIREYKQHFPYPPDTLLEHVYHPVIALVFWNVSMNGEIPQANLRQILLDDENTDSKYQGISRQSGRVHVISTMKIVSSSMTASFWFAEGPVQDILSAGSHWEAWLWDTNNWTARLGPSRVSRTTLRAGDAWCEGSGH
ncbi:uncharacterized protein GGS22DRAFT_194210 [Annulohypoxylon maeteangense]|uniref:uncharacterized protein n=1 Tax=Annulohypoxylon maeteangense TaxID=1927788 RepID=UPI002008BFA7|nr:uncharacterized protein GGS22DRAFT_194210 [Annulohypoxylon maeteangense]KAI0889907.1 hypothetical protein GGS22DRAFT_194210 [Annulohypoxylon maeteangense]